MNPRIYEFHGGIHPPECKEQSTRTPIAQLPLPARLVVPLHQHKGAPAKVVVQVGQSVLKGELLAEAQGYVSAPVHAPSSGTVRAIEKRAIAHPSGLPELCIEIETDGQERWIELAPCPDYQSRSNQELLDIIYGAGVVGLGGAVFPTATKLGSRAKRKIHTLVINGAECEPYITADDMQMRERADQVVSGIEVLAHLLEPDQILVGIEDNKPQAIEAMRRAASGTRVEIRVIPTKYPSGDAKRLIRILTGISIPGGTLSVDEGILCVNTGTAAAVHDAVLLGRPLISRICTLTGAALSAPQNVEVLIGTPMQLLLEHAGLQPDALERLVMGGPMMGFTLDRLDLPVVKATNCLIAASREEFPPAPPAQACIRCGHCAESCPANLLPQQLYWYARSSEHEQLRHHNLFDCIECGACAYVCPSSIPLVQYYRAAKGEIREQELKTQKAEHSKARFEARQARLEALEAEKAAKRQANMARAAQLKNQQAAAPADDDKAAAIRAAMERAKARKADGTEQSPEQKKLKIQLAKLKAEIKKNQRKLEERSGTEQQALEQAIARLQEQQQQLTAQLEQAEQPAPVAQAPTSAADEKKQKIQLAMAKAAVKKLSRQLESAEGAEKTALEAELAAKQAELDALQAPATVPPATTTAATDHEAAAKKQKIQLAMAKAAVKKLSRQLENPEAAEKTALEAELATRQAELDALQAALNTQQAQASVATVPPATTSPAADHEAAAKKRKIQLAMAKAAVKKLGRQLETAEAAEKTALEAELATRQAELDALQAVCATPEAPAQEAATSIATADSLVDAEAQKKLKIKLAMAKAALKKAERALADALAGNSADQDALSAQVSQCRSDLDEAQQALESLNHGKIKEPV